MPQSTRIETKQNTKVRTAEQRINLRFTITKTVMYLLSFYLDSNSAHIYFPSLLAVITRICTWFVNANENCKIHYSWVKSSISFFFSLLLLLLLLYYYYYQVFVDVWVQLNSTHIQRACRCVFKSVRFVSWK